MILSYTPNWSVIYDRKIIIVQATGHNSQTAGGFKLSTLGSVVKYSTTVLP
jgi:hypothetical protein